MKEMSRQECEKLLELSGEYSENALEEAYVGKLHECDPTMLPDGTPDATRRILAERYSDIVYAHGFLREEMIREGRIAAPAADAGDDAESARSEAPATDGADASRDIERSDASAKPGFLGKVADAVSAATGANVLAPSPSDGKAEKLKKAAMVGAGVAGAYMAGKAAAGAGSGIAEGAVKAGSGLIKKIAGAALSIAVILLLVTIVLPGACTGGGSADDGAGEEPRYAYTDVSLADVSWSRNGPAVYACVKATNDNQSVSLVGATVQAVFYDENGDECYSNDFELGYLLPGQSGYAYGEFMLSELTKVSRVDCFIEEGDTSWLSNDNGRYSQPLETTFKLTDHVAEDAFDRRTTDASVVVKNPNQSEYDNGCTVVLAFYSGEDIVSVAYGNVTSALPADGSVEGTFPLTEPDGYDRIECYAYPVFDAQDLR